MNQITRIRTGTVGALVLAAAVLGPAPDAGAEPAAGHGSLAPPLTIELSALDRETKVKGRREQGRGPLRYAEKVPVEPVTADSQDAWGTLPDGRHVWRVRVRAAQATSVELGFTRFDLPEGASLTVRGNGGKRTRGPYTAADNASHGQLWVPVVEGDTATATLVLERGVPRSEVDLALTHVLQGFLAFWDREAMAKTSEPCNADVACSVAEPWADEIRAVARIGIHGGLCSGTLVNNTAYDGRPLFLTAEHCLDNPVAREDGLDLEEVAASATVYWNYENRTCRTPGSDVAEGRGNGSLDQAQSGANLVSIWAPTDFALLELDDDPASAFDVRFSGWDRRDQDFEGGVSIHHPDAEEKRISLDHDPLDVVPLLSELSGGIRVRDWDVGLTEQGSSGAGLWSPGHRLIGQLSGGDLKACDALNHADTYGRLAIAWEGGGSADTRLKDHLDPVGAGSEVLGGMEACDVERLEITASPAAPREGEAVALELVRPLGGADVQWDLDGDRSPDQTGATVQTRFTDGGMRVVSATASFGGSCRATYEKVVDVRATEIKVTVGEAAPECGDSDGLVEPGERWRVPVTLKNTGETAVKGARAVLSRDGIASGQKDQFGYEMLDSRTAKCPYDFVWPVGGQEISFNPAAEDEGVRASDDGFSDPIWMRNFRFYGNKVGKLVMSTNGYLSTSTESDGADHTNDCPIPSAPELDDVGGRIMAFHGDYSARARTRYFEDCPRSPDTSGASGGCRIFQWNEYREEPLFDGEMPVQAILYSGSNEIVFQYGTSTPRPDVAPSVGIQDESGARGLMYGCKSAFFEDAPTEPRPESAVCFFAPKHPPEGPNPEAVALRTPVLEFGDLAAGERVTRLLEFQVPDTAACGEEIAVQLHGVTFKGGFKPGPGVVVSRTVGGEEGVCNADASCGAAKASPVDFVRGMWFNPDRGGHGIDVHTAGDTGFLVWYTYEVGQGPVWYQAVGELRDNQIHGDLLRFTLDPGKPLDLAADCAAAHSNPRCENVGEAIFTALTRDTGLFHWTLDDEPGGEPFEVLKASASPADRHTGHWFPPLEPGWGLTVNQQGDVEFGVLYFYDDAGEPTWALGVKGNRPNLVPLDQFSGFCPNCPWVETTSRRVGEYTRSFSGLTQGAVEVDVNLRPPLKGAWQREDVEIQMLSEPVQ